MEAFGGILCPFYLDATFLPVRRGSVTREVVLRVYPGARFQRCVLHSVKYSLSKVRRSQREALAQDLRKIYRAGKRSKALEAFGAFKARWQRKYPEVLRHW